VLRKAREANVVARRKPKKPTTEGETGSTAPQLDRLTRLLALLVVKGESQAEKIQLLSGAGFANTEIADLLGLTSNAVNVALHRLRSKK
jgi:DNA-directed RNA polymerase specialized sigma24 family protein